MMVNREQIGFIPEEKGGDIAGRLIVIDKDLDTGKEIKIDCTKFGSGAYSIPSSVEQLKFDTKAKVILAIETLQTPPVTVVSEATRDLPVRVVGGDRVPAVLRATQAVDQLLEEDR